MLHILNQTHSSTICNANMTLKTSLHPPPHPPVPSIYPPKQQKLALYIKVKHYIRSIYIRAQDNF